MKTNYTNYSNSEPLTTSYEDSNEIIIQTETDIEEVSDVESYENDTKMGYIDCEKLYLREMADKDSKPITILEKNDEVMITSEDDPDWYGIYTSMGQEGFCMKQYIRVES